MMRTCRPLGSHRARRCWKTHCSSRSNQTAADTGGSIEKQLDDMLLTAVNLHHDRGGDFLQAVSLSRNDDGLFANPYHSPTLHLWPKGMVFYDVSTSGMDTSVPDLKTEPRAVLRREVTLDDLSCGCLESALVRTGFQAQRLSVWLLQVNQCGDAEELRNIIASISECAAQGSLLIGQAIGWQSSEVREALASSGFMGSVTEWNAATSNAQQLQYIFTTQQHQFSLAQTGLYNRHVEAANDTDEDFFDNFS